MTAAIQFSDSSLAPPVELPPMDLSRLLMNRAGAVAYAWRRKVCGNCQDPFAAIAQLDGLVEPLVRELGRSLADPSDLPAAAWSRAQGVLRLSLTRPPDALHEEFAVLRALLDEVASQLAATEPERRRLRAILDAAQTQALALLRHRVMPHLPMPSVRFGGVVLEVC